MARGVVPQYQRAAMRGGLLCSNIMQLEATTVTSTGAHTLTPAASLYLYNTASASNPTIATADAEAGDLLLIVNIGSQTVTIVDTGATPGGGDIALGGGDAVLFVFNGTIWVTVSLSDNS